MAMASTSAAADLSALTDDQLVDAAWHAGDLRWKLTPRQQGVYDDIKAQLWGDGGYREPSGPQRRYVVKCCRRFGKTFGMGIIACELCATVPNARVYWAAETAKQVKNMITPNLRAILSDCPEDMRPRYIVQDGVWLWPNGAEIHIAGCEDEAKADRLRGDGADLFILDEAGHIAPLKYVYRSIALWMTALRMGRIVMPSSPAKSPGHAFTEYSVLAEAGEGGYSHRTVYQSDLTPDDIEEIKRECGGEATADWQREGLALDVVDTERAIIPEFAMRKGELVGEVERPRWFLPMVSMDVGWAPDLTVAIFAYWHFERAQLVIEDEVVIGRMTTDDLADALASTEARLWGEYHARNEGYGCAEKYAPYRVSDTDLQVICDLSRLHAMPFSPTVKDNKEAAINAVRLLVKAGQIRIHPRCKTLIAHLAAGIWNRQHSSYERLDGFGHFDAIDALVYLVRNVDRQHNPNPIIDPELKRPGASYQWSKHVRSEKAKRAQEIESLREMFVPKG